MHRPKKQDAERGQALIEFALTVPIFLMVVFGIIDLARLLFAFTQVIDAARQGVRYGIVEGLEQGNYQYLDCNGIEAAAQDTPGLVPGDSMTVTITYLNLTDNNVKLTQCPSPTANLLKDGAVLAVRVESNITPISPMLGFFDNNFHLDYTAKRAITESAAFTDEWPSAPPVPKHFKSQTDCDNGRVYFFWDPLTIWPDRIEIRDSFTNQVLQAIDYPETQYAYCKDKDPYAGRVCGVDINPDGGYGMYYMVLIQDGLEGTTSFDTTATCTGGGGGGGSGSGMVTFTGVVFHDKNGNKKQGGAEPGLSNVTVTLRSAGADKTLWTPDDVVKTTLTNVVGEFTIIGTIPEGETTQHFQLDFTEPPTMTLVTTGNASTQYTDMEDGDSVTINVGMQ